VTLFALALAVLLALERLWRHACIVRFFQRPVPPPPDATAPRPLVSILQPILSGDPTMPRCLERSLFSETAYPVEFVYLVDEDDTEARRLCEDLTARSRPERRVTTLLLPPPGPGQNPKMVKLIAGAEAARGDVLCVLDDDTTLPDFGLEQCLPFLEDPKAGVAFGLPYYAHFGNLWSTLVAAFVNATSLATYVPYAALTPPVTINGMFYAVRRDVLASVGGFAGLEETLADDFAVARRFREHGLRLIQTPLRHAVRTHIRDGRHYRTLMHRWFTFPRESVLRHVSPWERAVVLALGGAGNVLPLVLVLLAAAAGTAEAWAAVAAFFALDLGLIAWRSRAYLGGATPAHGLLLTPLVLLVLPLQMLTALLAPRQRIVWRGIVMEVEKGGGFRFVRRPRDR